MKTRMVCFTVALALFAAHCSPMRAGDKGKKDDPLAGLPKPGPEHKLLAQGEGTWNAEVKMWMDPTEPSKAVESKGVMKRKMILDGHYMTDEIETHLDRASLRIIKRTQPEVGSSPVYTYTSTHEMTIQCRC